MNQEDVLEEKSVEVESKEETESDESEENDDGNDINDDPEKNRLEEAIRQRKVQLADIKRERELKERMTKALRREVEERVRVFSQSADQERNTRQERNEIWRELNQNRPEMTTRVRKVAEMWSNPKKKMEAEQLKRELAERRRLLAATRARLLREMVPDEPVEDVKRSATANVQPQSSDRDRSCDSCGARSIAEEEQQGEENKGGENVQEEFSVEEIPFVANNNVAAGAGGGQMSSDYLLALALQQAEMRGQAAENRGRGRGRGGGERGGRGGGGSATL